MDNLDFFQLTAEQIDKYLQDLCDLLGNPEFVQMLSLAILSTLYPVRNSPYLEIMIPLDNVQRSLEQGMPIDIPKEVYEKFLTIPSLQFEKLSHRIAMYIVRRLLVLQGASAGGDFSNRINDIFLQELNKWKNYLSEIKHILVREEKAKAAGRTWFEGHFARHVPFLVSPHFELIGNKIHPYSATSLSHVNDGSVYAIITDPPYGFNTGHKPKTLLDLYVGLVSEIFRVLDPAGAHIVMCTVARTKTGKYSPTFCGRQFVTNLILQEASKRALTVQSEPGLRPKKLSDVPYYWRSKRGVDRYILHFYLHGGAPTLQPPGAR